MHEDTTPQPTPDKPEPHNRAVGITGETIAARYLESLGYQIIARNWRCARGELDIVAVDGSTAVFVEVKSRTSRRTGHPFEAVTTKKVDRLRKLAGAWLADHCPPTFRGARIDVIGVQLAADGTSSVEHLQGVA